MDQIRAVDGLGVAVIIWPLGAIAKLASAATVAASSFTVVLQSCQQLLNRVCSDEYDKLTVCTRDGGPATDRIYLESQPQSTTGAQPDIIGVNKP